MILKKSTRMPSSEKEQIILGIDPGLKRIGYGVIQKSRSGFLFLDTGMLHAPGTKTQIALRVSELLDALIQKYCPDIFAIEKIYFGRNITSVLAVSELKGVLLVQAEKRCVPIVEVTPLEVKSMVCGYGKADKLAVRKIILQTLVVPKTIKSRDAIDALAIAIAGYYKYTQQLIQS